VESRVDERWREHSETIEFATNCSNELPWIVQYGLLSWLWAWDWFSNCRTRYSAEKWGRVWKEIDHRSPAWHIDGFLLRNISISWFVFDFIRQYLARLASATVVNFSSESLLLQ
jgi:hypothetical protein